MSKNANYQCINSNEGTVDSIYWIWGKKMIAFLRYPHLCIYMFMPEKSFLYGLCVTCFIMLCWLYTVYLICMLFFPILLCLGLVFDLVFHSPVWINMFELLKAWWSLLFLWLILGLQRLYLLAWSEAARHHRQLLGSSGSESKNQHEEQRGTPKG